MKTGIKSIITLAIVLLINTVAWAQENKPASSAQDTSEFPTEELNGIGRYHNKKVELRWAPGSFSGWNLGNISGYSIQRQAYTGNPMFDPEAEPVDSDFVNYANVSKWSLETFQANATDSNDVNVGIAMELLYGADQVPTATGGMNLIKTILDDQARRHAFALLSADFSKTAAKGLGLSFEDKEVQPNKFYLYRIFFSKEDEMMKTDTAYIAVDTRFVYRPDSVKHCFVETFDQQLAIFWTRQNDLSFTAYDIERSLDKKKWEQLNDRPFLSSDATDAPHLFTDTNLINNKTYYYRVRGYTPFGEKGNYSIVMQGSPKDITPPAPAFGVTAKDMGNGIVEIKWDAVNNEPDFDGFYIGRSNSAVGPFDKISTKLSGDTRAFGDFTPNPLDNNYYVVISADKLGNEATSYVALGYILDSVPPTPPTGLKAVIDTNGIVGINWDQGPEADIIGYRIYRANQTDVEFSQLSGELIPGLYFEDTVVVKTLSEEVYYKVVAVDHRYNHSEYSEILMVKKPDLIPPVQAKFSNYESTESGISLNWYATPSKDAVSLALFRSKFGSTDKADTLYRGNPQVVGTYIDTNLLAGEKYQYQILVTDDAGNKTLNTALTAKTPITLQSKTSINASAKMVNEQVQIDWSIKSPADAKVIIYLNNAKILATLPGTDNKFNYNGSTSDVLEIKIVYKDGSETNRTVVNWVR